MRKTIIALAAPLLGVVLCLLLTASASARHPYGRYYPSHAPAVVAGYGYGYGYVALPYGYTYNPRRAYRQSLRYGYPPLPPRVPVAVYGRPYYGYVLQPLGPVRGPRDYMYQPGYEQPLRRHAPLPANPRTQPPPAPPQPGPELIPTPSSDL